MAKRRKTKRQKVISDTRHSVSTPRLSQSQEELSSDTHAHEVSYTFEPIRQTPKSQAQQIMSVSDLKYLSTDIRKIAVVTALIIITELGIFWSTNGF